MFCAEVQTVVVLFVYEIAGNKTDRAEAREVPTHIGQAFADRYEMKFIETSAKEADNVDTLFLDIAMELTHDARERERLSPGLSATNISSDTRSISSCTKCFKS